MAKHYNQMTLKEKIEFNKANFEKIQEEGQYLGYPDCCIQAYQEYISRDALTKEQNEIWKDPVWFMPCKECAIKLVAKEITMDELLANRYKKLPHYTELKTEDVAEWLAEIKEMENKKQDADY